MLKFKYKNGCVVFVTPTISSQKFPASIVEPDDSYTIRQIYDNWRKGKPTSPHLFPAEFDEEGSKFDDSDASDDFRENPIDISQIHNESFDAVMDFEQERAYVAQQKQKKKVSDTQKNDTDTIKEGEQ